MTAAASLAPTATDAARVLVELAGPGKARTRLGSAAKARRDRRLTAGERAAIDSLVRAVQLLRTRAKLAGIDDAGRAVTLVLRESDAETRGPWATSGRISVGSGNALTANRPGDARRGVVLPVDVALHELTHVVQFVHIPAGATPHAALLEGIADSVAILATGDDTLGEEYFRIGASGRPVGAVREHGRTTVSGKTLGRVDTTYVDALRDSDDEHAGGGVVAAAFISIRGRLGAARAEQLLWAVIRDDAAWRTGGSWKAFAEALRRAAGTDPTASTAVAAALAVTGLDAA